MGLKNTFQQAHGASRGNSFRCMFDWLIYALLVELNIFLFQDMSAISCSC